MVELKETYPNISLEVAVPCENQFEKWDEWLHNRYIDVLEKCDVRAVLQKEYTADCMHKCNCYIVDRSAFVIAIWNSKPGVTVKTVKYDQKRGCKVLMILL